MAFWVWMAIVELTPGMTFRMEFLWVVWWEGVRRERIVSLATKLSRMRRVGCDAGVSSRARQAARFSPVLLEDWEFPIAGGRSALMAKYGIMGLCSQEGGRGVSFRAGGIGVIGSTVRPE